MRRMNKMSKLLKPKEVERERYTEEEYDDMLDECYPEVEVAGITFSPSYALKELDPIAYRCGFADYQEYVTMYICPICGNEYEDDDDALLCCQDLFECPVCGEEYEDSEEAEACCDEEDML